MSDTLGVGEAWKWLNENSDAITAVIAVGGVVFTPLGAAIGWVIRKLKEPAEQRKLRDEVTRARSRSLGLGRTVQLAFEKNEAVLKAVKPGGTGTAPLPQYASLDTLVQRSWDAGNGVAAAIAQHIFDGDPQTPEQMEATIKANGFGGALARELRNCARQGAKPTPNRRQAA